MKLAVNFHNHPKTIRAGTICLLILFTTMSMTISGVYALPPDKNFGGECDNDVNNLTIFCCWTETDEEGIELKYCQICDIDTKTGDLTGCGEKHQSFNKNDCSVRIQLKCPEGDVPQFEQDSPLTKRSDIKDLEEMQPVNTGLSSTVEDDGSEQTTNEESNSGNFTDSTSQDSNNGAELVANFEPQNQSSEDWERKGIWRY